jgi:hypothetical protein
MNLTYEEKKQFLELYRELVCKHYDSYAATKSFRNNDLKWSKATLDTKQDVGYIGPKDGE